ncbi:hypothetical protein HU200_024003 [Digitaria exilis]|uniref:Myb-like domain-containing protein n=1 Tax=Digitaria exilis TaxID=1010633 RepID=A0A835CB34_9POAL|nr:hypothetical protein HU200_024003 [Digitaria exilis]
MYPQHFNPFGVPPGYHQFHTTSSSYHGIPLHDDVGQYHQGGFRFSMAADPSSPIGSTALCGVPAINEEYNESSPEEGNQTSGRRVWTEEENLRLVSAWLNNSNDPIRGVDKKYDHYWKEIAKEYNKHSPKERRRTPAQLKTHWNSVGYLQKGYPNLGPKQLDDKAHNDIGLAPQPNKGPASLRILGTHPARGGRPPSSMDFRLVRGSATSRVTPTLERVISVSLEGEQARAC